MRRETLERGALRRDEDHCLCADLLCSRSRDARVTQVNRVEGAAIECDSSLHHRVINSKSVYSLPAFERNPARLHRSCVTKRILTRGESQVTSARSHLDHVPSRWDRSASHGDVKAAHETTRTHGKDARFSRFSAPMSEIVTARAREDRSRVARPARRDHDGPEKINEGFANHWTIKNITIVNIVGTMLLTMTWPQS